MKLALIAAGTLAASALVAGGAFAQAPASSITAPAAAHSTSTAHHSAKKKHHRQHKATAAPAATATTK